MTMEIIIEQIKQFTNIIVLQHVNTGNRMLDGVLSLLFNTILSMMIQKSFKYFTVAKHKYWGCENNKNNPNYVDLNEIDLSLFPKDKIEAYLFEFHWYKVFSQTEFFKFLEEKKIKINTFKTTKHCIIDYTNYRLGVNEENEIKKFCFPIWKYIEKEEIQYIWLYGDKLFSNNFYELQKFINEYKMFVFNNNIVLGKIQRKVFNVCDEGTQGIIGINTLGYINSLRTFDVIYFDQKQKLIEIVKKFQENKMYPQGLALDNKLGILLHGPPGTGKTGCICAIANYLNREILMVNSLHENDLEKTLGLLKHYKDTHVIVFDEFDHILAMNESKSESNISHKESLLYAINEEERKKIFELMKTQKKINYMGLFLQFLDGTVDNSNRIIIATTNFPEKINPILLRPGRFDLKIELGYCSVNMFTDIVRAVYPKEVIDINENKLDKIKLSPLNLINTLLTTSSLNDVIKKLEIQN